MLFPVVLQNKARGESRANETTSKAIDDKGKFWDASAILSNLHCTVIIVMDFYLEHTISDQRNIMWG